MELKKSPQANLQNKRLLFFEIGFAVSLLVVIGAFAWNLKEREIVIPEMENAGIEEEIIEITRQDNRPQPVRQQIQVLSEIINIVKDDTKITQDIKFDDWDETAEVVPISNNRIGDVVNFDGDEIFTLVENNPLFMGKNMDTFGPWVQANAKYPPSAERAKIQGRVNVKFVIEKDGTLSNLEILSSPDESLSKEVLRVISSSPKWTPGKQRQKNVRVAFTITVTFRLK